MNNTENLTPINTVRELSRDECVTRLQAHQLGRLAVSEGALPLIVPVNYAMDSANVVFRTQQGGLLDRTCRNTIVAFEIDDFDPSTEAGWSVVVVGTATVLYASEWLRAVELGLSSAGAADGSMFVKIVPGIITGRAITGAVSA
jgi:uncharacterized protein